MQTSSSNLLLWCLLLIAVPPAVVLAYRYDHWRSMIEPPQIAPNQVEGEVLYFTAPWCGACERMKDAVAQLRREGFNIRPVNVDAHRALAEKYNVRAVPTFVYVRDGQEVRRRSGFMSPQALRGIWASAAPAL
jgi:thiol-disulfide isomerase/thioredoxin